MEPTFNTLNFACTPLGFTVLILMLLLSVVFSLYFKSVAFIPVVLAIGFVFANAHPPKEETPTVNTQESTQESTQENSKVKVKWIPKNMNCTALENGDYLCKKQK